MNIPIYRAKKINSNEYIKGTGTTDFLNINNISGFEHYNDGTRLWLWSNYFWIEIDPTTLAIHFPDTNIKDLFFGIDNGKGASIIEAVFIDDDTPFKGIAIHTHHGYVFFDKNCDWVHITKLKDIKAIGIQE